MTSQKNKNILNFGDNEKKKKLFCYFGMFLIAFLFLNLTVSQHNFHLSATDLNQNQKQYNYQNTIFPFGEDDNSFKFTWEIDEATKKIKIKLNVATLGWAAVGFNNQPKMPNADVIMCYFDKAGKTNCSDRKATGRKLPQLDTELGGKDDLESVSGKQARGRSVFHFSRRLDTQDEKNDFKIAQGQSVFVLFSYRTKGNPDTEGEFLYHDRRTVKEIVLWPKNAKAQSENEGLTQEFSDNKQKEKPNKKGGRVLQAAIQETSDVKKMTLKFDNYEIPAQETTYVCKNFDIQKQLQQITGKSAGTPYHVVAFQPVIDQKEYMHHLIMFSCDKDIEVSDKIYQCMLSMVHPGCFQIQFEWGLGSGDYILPQNVGILWGVAENRKVIIQYHYNNPDKVAGVKDSSAINVFFTSKLRKYDSATMLLEQPESMISIPPKQKAFKVENHCAASCTSKIDDYIYVFAVFLHGHTHLKKIRTEIYFADGTIDDTTLREDNFVFNNQKYVYLDKPIKISPGDEMKTICEYDTTKSNKVVKGGESTSNEMCISFLNFYPRERGLSKCIAGLPGDLGCAKFEKYKRKAAVNSPNKSSQMKNNS